MSFKNGRFYAGSFSTLGREKHFPFLLKYIFSTPSNSIFREAINHSIRSVMAPYLFFFFFPSYFLILASKNHLPFKESSKRQSLSVQKLCVLRRGKVFAKILLRGECWKRSKHLSLTAIKPVSMRCVVRRETRNLFPYYT